VLHLTTAGGVLHRECQRRNRGTAGERGIMPERRRILGGIDGEQRQCARRGRTWTWMVRGSGVRVVVDHHSDHLLPHHHLGRLGLELVGQSRSPLV
jgi:hypothetical protein